MTQKEALSFLKKQDNFDKFINGEIGYLCVNVYNVPIIIFNSGTDIEYFFRFPYNPQLNYSKADEFIRLIRSPLRSEIQNKEKIRLTDIS